MRGQRDCARSSAHDFLLCLRLPPSGEFRIGIGPHLRDYRSEQLIVVTALWEIHPPPPT